MRHAKKLPSHPISCPKLRELHPEAAATTACDCSFSRRAPYPTPLLLALKASEIPAFRQTKPANTPNTARPSAATPAGAKHRLRGGGPGAPVSAAPPADGESTELLRRAEQALARIRELERHRRGILSSLRRARHELAGLFDEAGSETLSLASGELQREATDGEQIWKFRLEL
jgi:hypothetical protein